MNENGMVRVETLLTWVLAGFAIFVVVRLGVWVAQVIEEAGRGLS